MAVTFAYLGAGDWKAMRSVAQTGTGVTMANVVQAKAGDCWQPNRKIAWFQGDLGRIEEAYEALRHAGYYVNEFQRHPHGWDKVPKPCGSAEERTMKDLLQNLEEAKGGDVEALVKQLAAAQERLVDAIEKAHAASEDAWTIISSVSDNLLRQLKGRTITAGGIEDLFKKYKIDVGDGLGSNLVDLIALRGGKVYPEQYPVRRSRWTLIER